MKNEFENPLLPKAAPAQRLAVATILLIIVGSLTWLKDIAPSGVLPPEKQAIEDRYNQERAAGQQNPASRDSINPPPPSTFQYPTGIFDETETDSLFPAQDIIVTNHWQDMANGHFTVVYVGASAPDSSQGLVIVSDLSGNSNPSNTETFPTPIKSGAVKIVAVHNLQLQLLSVNGTTFIFDVPSKTFVK